MAGRYAAVGPFSVQQLDLDSGEISCLAEDASVDFVGPQMAPDGALYYIRRPYAGTQAKFEPLSVVTDTLLFPFRMAYAIFQFFNFFSMRYTGRPLTTSKGALQKTPNLKQMMLWGNLLDVDRVAHGGEPDAPALVPSSWQLVRESPDGKEVLATGVVSFDLESDGSVLYSNGSSVHRIEAGNRLAKRLLVGQMIEQVAAL
jgi:hypothetical protein